ncbi:MAG: CNNM domain-containing protein [Candidatus Krumholzibacteria bacterium]|nr:CNNM domain-containing protein [Candidatus Krumholzibacteria bacterium]
MSVEVLSVISAVAFLIAAFSAGAETAIIACDRVRLRHRAGKGDNRARLLLQYIKNPEYLFSIVLIGTNLGMIGCTTTFTAIMIHYFGDSGATIATAILVPSLLIFQEILPKGVFLYYADRASVLSILPLKLFAITLYPVIRGFAEFTNFLAAAFGVRKMDRKVRMTMQELLFHLESSTRAGAIPSDTMQLASRAVELIDFSAKDVMLPLDKVVMAEEGMTTEEYRQIFAQEHFSRLPIFRHDRQNVVGYLSIHNLLRAGHSRRGAPVIESPYLVSMDTPIVGMMIRMKNQGCHMAMIRDEQGAILGMTTLEDILEQLVGAIVDEFH